MHVIVFSPKLTPRIKYIFNFIFKDILKTEIELTSDSGYFLQSGNAKLSYADKPLADELFFKNTNLLSANKVEAFKPKTIEFGEYKVPFPVDDSPFPFDVFAASFYILSRYEEYVYNQTNDGNFKAADSLQLKWKVLNRPIIDEWALLIKNMVRKKYPSLIFADKKFAQQSTINFTLKPDVPQQFLPKTKFIFSSIFNKEQKYLSTLFDELTGLEINPEIVIQALSNFKPNHQPIYFISFPPDAKKRLKFEDSRTILANKSIGLFRIGATTKTQATQLKSDLHKLNEVKQGALNISSQQITDLRLPSCYLNLLSTGITNDYSMGYEDTPGFRAGTCTPFCWYDLQLEKVTAININPYLICDVAFKYMNFAETVKTIHTFIDVVKMVNGHFYSSWQLKSLSEIAKFKRLKAAYEDMINYAGS